MQKCKGCGSLLLIHSATAAESEKIASTDKLRNPHEVIKYGPYHPHFSQYLHTKFVPSARTSQKSCRKDMHYYLTYTPGKQAATSVGPTLPERQVRVWSSSGSLPAVIIKRLVHYFGKYGGSLATPTGKSEKICTGLSYTRKKCRYTEPALLAILDAGTSIPESQVTSHHLEIRIQARFQTAHQDVHCRSVLVLLSHLLVASTLDVSIGEVNQ